MVAKKKAKKKARSPKPAKPFDVMGTITLTRVDVNNLINILNGQPLGAVRRMYDQLEKLISADRRKRSRK